jgi:flagellar assembly factor FliW
MRWNRWFAALAVAMALLLASGVGLATVERLELVRSPSATCPSGDGWTKVEGSSGSVSEAFGELFWPAEGNSRLLGYDIFQGYVVDVCIKDGRGRVTYRITGADEGTLSSVGTGISHISYRIVDVPRFGAILVHKVDVADETLFLDATFTYALEPGGAAVTMPGSGGVYCVDGLSVLDTYTIEETEPPTGYALDPNATRTGVSPEEGKDCTSNLPTPLVFKNAKRVGAILVHKVDVADETLFLDATFTYALEPGGAAVTMPGSGGVYCVDGLSVLDTYTIEETEPPTGYALDPNATRTGVSPEEGKDCTSNLPTPLVFKNAKRVGAILVHKVDVADETLFLDATFTYALEPGGAAVTMPGSGGVYCVDGLSVLDTYTIEETEPPTGYALDPNATRTGVSPEEGKDCTSNLPTPLVFKNAKRVGAILVHKVDVADETLFLDATFTYALEPGGAAVTMPGSGGVYCVDGLSVLDTYTIEETEPPTGYALDPNATRTGVSPEEGKDCTSNLPTPLVFKNAKRVGAILVHKVDVADETLFLDATFTYALEPGGAAVTMPGSGGVYCVDGLSVLDTYTIEETEPPTGYALDPNATRTGVSPEEGKDCTSNLPTPLVFKNAKLDTGQPSIEVRIDSLSVDGTSLYTTFTITNASGGPTPVTIESVAFDAEYIQRGGRRTAITFVSCDPTLESLAGTTIAPPPGSESFEVVCEVDPSASTLTPRVNEVRLTVFVRILDRDMTFSFTLSSSDVN